MIMIILDQVTADYMKQTYFSIERNFNTEKTGLQ